MQDLSTHLAVSVRDAIIPGLGAWDVLEQLRFEHDGPRVPVLSVADKDRGAAASVVAYLSKRSVVRDPVRICERVSAA